MATRIVRHNRTGRFSRFLILAAIFLIIIVLVISFFTYLNSDMKRRDYAIQNRMDLLTANQFQLPQTLAVKNLASAAMTVKIPKAAEEEPADPNVKTEHIRVETRVPQSPAVEASFFEDAIFIGDSISLGIKNSGTIPAKNMLAEKNVGIDSVLNDKAVYFTTGSEKKTLFQAIPEKVPNPAKIYVLLGLNGMPGYDNDYHIGLYGKLIDRLKESYPEAQIYVQSLTPMTQNSDYVKKFSQKKIDEFNVLIEEMAKEKSIYYLNIQEVLKDENGYLRQEYAYDAKGNGDGMHMLSKAHKVMYQYYRTHTVQKDGYTDKIV